MYNNEQAENEWFDFILHLEIWNCIAPEADNKNPFFFI